jgi:DNA-binding transcriptional MocR family regulator
MSMATPRTAKLRYEQLADRIETQIGNGTLTSHDRVPSLRRMSQTAGVSVGTVVQAYVHLESRGILYTRPRSGYFVSPAANPAAMPTAKRIRSARPTDIATNVLDRVIESLGRTDLIAFNSAIVTSAARINGRLNGIARGVLREHPGNANDLAPVAGIESLRREIAKRMVLAGVAVSPGDVVITNGTMEALTLALGALCKAGDTVLIESPTYPGILQMIGRLRLKVVEVPNHPGRGIDVDAVEQLIEKTRIAVALLQANFNNPTGALTPDVVKRRLVEVLTGAGVRIVEDDIYGDLHFGAVRPRPLSAFDDSGLVVTCASISKTVAIGYRLGWAISPRYAADITRAKFSSSVACPTLQQRVVARYFAAGLHDRHIRQVREALALNCRRFREAVERGFPAGTRVSHPDGGVVLWVELPQGVDGVGLFEQALAHRIGTAPGVIFSARGDYRNFVRLSAGVQWTPEAQRALRTLAALAGAKGAA